ncbi:hypothetical protein RND71_009638 [Anisodus tanguticus]|uniref:acetate--CoA ligase n=1 Tax=Anisodus tanguticus TaxID=243964 RepID=A0AAE1VHE1_9SOLA|nr:hypothetical protein RND71_009638 [Anisodus tanguticus]
MGKSISCPCPHAAEPPPPHQDASPLSLAKNGETKGIRCILYFSASPEEEMHLMVENPIGGKLPPKREFSHTDSMGLSYGLTNPINTNLSSTFSRVRNHPVVIPSPNYFTLFTTTLQNTSLTSTITTTDQNYTPLQIPTENLTVSDCSITLSLPNHQVPITILTLNPPVTTSQNALSRIHPQLPVQPRQLHTIRPTRETENLIWFKGGKTNICYNCLDRNIDAGNGNKIAIFWEGNEPGRDGTLTYNQLLARVCQQKFGLFLLRDMKIVLKDRHSYSVVFAGFSAESLAQRIVDCKPKVVITCNAVRRGPKTTFLKDIRGVGGVRGEVTGDVVWGQGRGGEVRRWGPKGVMLFQNIQLHVMWNGLDAEDPLFLLYTSGSTGKPKGKYSLHQIGR